MLTKLMIATVCVACVASVNLFIPENPLSSDITELRVNRRSKRDAASDFMAAFYDVTIAVNGVDITGRLKRKDVIDDVALPNYIYKKDWATYTSDELDGVFIVHRHKLNHSLLNIEGYMVHERSPYLIQPHSRGHVVHLLEKPITGSKYDSTIRQMAERMKHKSREKRLRRPDWVVELVVVTDGPMRALVKTRLKAKDIDCYIWNYYAMVIMFIDKRMATLRQQGTNIYCRGKSLQIFTKDVPGLTTRPPRTNSYLKRRIVQAVDVIAGFTKYMKRSRPYDHLMILSGLELYHGQLPLFGVCNTDSICTDNSVSTVGFDFNLRLLQVASHEICHSMGVRHDGDPGAEKCLPTKEYIMTETPPKPYISANKDNWWRYSKCTAELLSKYVFSLPKDGNCLDLAHTKLKPMVMKQSLYGHTMTLDQQCKLVGGSISRHEGKQDNKLICRDGLQCAKQVLHYTVTQYYVPYPGTPCGHRKVCINSRCVD